MIRFLVLLLLGGAASSAAQAMQARIPRDSAANQCDFMMTFRLRVI